MVDGKAQKEEEKRAFLGSGRANGGRSSVGFNNCWALAYGDIGFGRRRSLAGPLYTSRRSVNSRLGRRQNQEVFTPVHGQ